MRRVAVNLVMDKSSYHSGVGNNLEWGEGLATKKVPIERGRRIIYLYNLNILLATDYLILTCCHRMGRWLIECRRENSEKATDGFYETDWESFIAKSSVKFNHENVANLCAPRRDLEMSNDLGECIKLAKITSMIRAMFNEHRESNLFILPPVVLRKELM